MEERVRANTPSSYPVLTYRAILESALVVAKQLRQNSNQAVWPDGTD
jgi:hypothetical protein